MNNSATMRVPAVLYEQGQPPKSYHADLSVGGSPDEVIIQFEHPEANHSPVTWTVPRSLLTLVREEQLGSSGEMGNFAALTFGPQCLREHGWTQIGPLDGPFTLDLWDRAIGEFLSQLGQVVPGNTAQSLQLRVQS
ncbi:MAG TPA: hypothetical protein VGH44_06795 [Candidatus Saccharimonadia bacterium]|jgi:hypothetical protein